MSEARTATVRTSDPLMVVPNAQEEIIAQIGDLDLAYCFQCGVCSGF